MIGTWQKGSTGENCQARIGELMGLDYSAVSRERKRLLDRIEADRQAEMASMFGLGRTLRPVAGRGPKRKVA
jgi:hypothetical protein